MAIDSVPPSANGQNHQAAKVGVLLTSECSCYKDGCKATNTPNKRCILNEPIMATNVTMRGISSAVDCNSKNNKNLVKRTYISDIQGQISWLHTHYDGNDLQQTKPIFKLMPSLVLTVGHACLAAYFAVYSDSCNVGQNEHDPEDQTQAPAWKSCRPILQD